MVSTKCTCWYSHLNIRAVHIELVDSMSTHSFILALLRFTNIYGVPLHIYSDNARSFIVGCNFIEELFTSSKFNENFAVYNIKYIKIPLYPTWVESMCECLIRIVKTCMYKMIRQSLMLWDPNYHRQHTEHDKLETFNLQVFWRFVAWMFNTCFLHPNAKTRLVLKLDNQTLRDSDPPSSRACYLHNWVPWVYVD